MTYAEFGAAFVREAVTAERICAVIRSIAGDEVSVGPLRAGPRGVATVTATGTVSPATAELTGDDPLAYVVLLPVALALDVAIGDGNHRFTATGAIKLSLVARLQPPLAICVEPVAPESHDVTISVHAKGVQGRVIARLGDMEGELRREVASYVAQRIATDAAEYAEIDVRPLIEKAWPSG